MASNFTLRTNVPRTELLVPGWGKSRLASALRASKVTPAGTYKQSELPQEFMRVPEAGVIILKPHSASKAWWTDESLSALYTVQLTDFDYNPSQVFLTTTSSNAVYAERTSPTASLLGLTPTPVGQAIIDDIHGGNVVELLRTKSPFADNEGWALWLRPHGTYVNRAENYVGIYFGGRFHLHLGMDGWADLWFNEGTYSSPNWALKTSFQVLSGGVLHDVPFQITCIPLGFDYLLFQFSQGAGFVTHGYAMAGTAGPQSGQFLFRLSRFGIDAPYDSVHSQYVKTNTAQISIFGPTDVYQWGTVLSHVAYPATATLTTAPEVLPEVNADNDPIIRRIGFEGQYSGSATPTSITTSYFNWDGTAWDKTADTKLVAQFVFAASSDLKYTPELWSYDLEVYSRTHTPSLTPVDLSAYWQYVRWQITTDPDVTSFEAKISRAADYDDIFKLGGSIQLKYGSDVVFDGYIERKQPVLEGPLAILTDQIEARDMWSRLNETYVDDYEFLDGLTLLSVLKALIKRAGFVDADINVDDPDGYIASLSFGGFTDPNDQNGLNSDASVGDVIREAVKGFGLYPIRVRWSGGQWQIYAAPQYDSASPPTKKFYLRTSLMANANAGDSTRWAAHEYKITGNPEWTTLPGFNGLIGRAATGTGQGAEGLQSTISAIEFDDASVNDPTYAEYYGRARIKKVTPPEMAFPQDQLTLDQHTRAYWDRFHKGVRALEFPGEWQPEIDVDDFIWVIGVDQSGNRVSYGAYRIDFIDIEADKDWSSRNMGWDVHGSYSCVYVGEATDGSTPMFTDVLP